MVTTNIIQSLAFHIVHSVIAKKFFSFQSQRFPIFNITVIATCVMNNYYYNDTQCHVSTRILILFITVIISLHAGERNILSLHVKCDNTADGCQWIGELRSLEEHLTNCDFALLPCPNQCKDGDKIHKLMRKHIENHKNKACSRRQYECPHCKESGEYQERMTIHILKNAPR